MNEKERSKNIWEEIADLFYRNQSEEGMQRFLANVAALSQDPAAASWINPLFDALERGDYVYAADLLRYEITGGQ